MKGFFFNICIFIAYYFYFFFLQWAERFQSCEEGTTTFRHPQGWVSSYEMYLFVVQHLNYNYPKFEVSLQCHVEPSSSDMSSSLCNSL